MTNRVFYQRLEQQNRHQDVAGVGLDVEVHAQPVLEPRPLDIEIALEEIELLGKAYFLPAALSEGESQQIGEPDHHPLRLRGVLSSQDGDRVQGVEEKVRLELGAEGVQSSGREGGFELRGCHALCPVHPLEQHRPPGEHDRPVVDDARERAPHEARLALREPCTGLRERQVAAQHQEEIVCRIRGRDLERRDQKAHAGERRHYPRKTSARRIGAPALRAAQYEWRERGPGEPVHELVHHVPLPVDRTAARERNDDVLRADEQRDAEPDGDEPHRHIMASPVARGNGGANAGPVVTRSAPLVTESERPFPIPLCARPGRSLLHATPTWRHIMLRPVVVATLGLALTLPRLAAQTSSQDSTAIRATAHDYIDGWYEGDGARMERALHPHLAKRLVYEDQQGHSRLVDLTALELVQTTRTGVGKIPPAERRDSVTILDVFGNAAIVRIDATTWVDFLQEVKWNGRWAIVNVVWVNRPKAP